MEADAKADILQQKKETEGLTYSQHQWFVLGVNFWLSPSSEMDFQKHKYPFKCVNFVCYNMQYCHFIHLGGSQIFQFKIMIHWQVFHF